MPECRSDTRRTTDACSVNIFETIFRQDTRLCRAGLFSTQRLPFNLQAASRAFQSQANRIQADCQAPSQICHSSILSHLPFNGYIHSVY